MPEVIDRLFRHFIGFSLVGVASTLASMLLFYIGVEILHYNAVAIYVMAYALTIVGSYFANSILVFHVRLSVYECLKFFCVYASGMFLGAILLRVLEWATPSIRPVWLGMAVVPVTVGWNFLFVNHIMNKFRHRQGDV